MKIRIAAIILSAGVLAFGFGPGATAAVTGTAATNGKIVCGGVRSLDIGFCVDNPFPWAAAR